MNSSKFNDSLNESMTSTRKSRPTSRRRGDTRNVTSPSAKNPRQMSSSMGDDMVCICIKPQALAMNAMNNQSCNCSCHSDQNFSMGMDMMQNQTFDISTSRRQGRQNSLAELEETAYNMPNDFDESILELEDDPSNSVTLGRFYRIDSFR